jgi:hypothetical protein
MKQIFKKGDKVFCVLGGWGTVISINKGDYPIAVEFDRSHYTYSEDGRVNDHTPPTLSFTEYKLEGFSQERPEPLPKIGDVVWGKGFHTTDWSIGHYLGKQHASYKISSTPNALSYWLAFTITTKNPYANE